MNQVVQAANELKPYYVYELKDPKNNKTFYVGKGQGKRALAHGLEAENDENNTDKHNAIRNIRNQGSEPKVIVIGRYDTESEALSVESTLIHWIYGIEKLTNIQGGYRREHIRPKNEYSTLIRLDIPKTNTRRTRFAGKYSETFRESGDEFNVIEYLESIRDEIESRIDIRFEDELITSDPRMTNLLLKCNGVYIKIQRHHTKKNRFKVDLSSLTGSSTDKEWLKTVAMNTGCVAKDKGKYANIPGKQYFEDIEDAIPVLKNLYNDILIV